MRSVILRKPHPNPADLDHDRAGQVRAGKVRIIAVTNGQRQPVAPEIPTVSEAGYPSLTVEGGAGGYMLLPLGDCFG
jgi:hypothetical protein